MLPRGVITPLISLLTLSFGYVGSVCALDTEAVAPAPRPAGAAPVFSPSVPGGGSAPAPVTPPTTTPLGPRNPAEGVSERAPTPASPAPVAAPSTSSSQRPAETTPPTTGPASHSAPGGPAEELASLKEQLKQLELKLTQKEEQLQGAVENAAVGQERGDSAWMLAASGLVMLMVPGLALFYGGMVRRKNVLATMMESMAALAVVGVYWVAIGYALAFGPSLITVNLLGVEKGGIIGWSWQLFFLKGVAATDKLPAANITVFLHVAFQGMFAILTPALISGAVAERIRFWPFCLFMVLWVTFVYCPLAHMVWAFDWFDPTLPPAQRGTNAIGLLGKMGALDYAGGTVVHIAAGLAGLACCLVIGKRSGYPQLVAHPNGIALTLLGAGLLWFGWFGFNGGSAIAATAQASSAFLATQAAAAAAGLGWMVVEWLHKGKPTALGLASGVVAGLVAVTPASGFVSPAAGLAIGLLASPVCYAAVALKSRFGYDDTLDAFGVHGVGGFIGAVLTGVFCSALVNPAGQDGVIPYLAHRSRLKELQSPTGPLAEAQKALEQAQAEQQRLEQPNAASPDTTSAQDKLETARQRLLLYQAQLDSLQAELKTLQELADKQDDVAHQGQERKTGWTQLIIQVKAAVFSVVFAFAVSLMLCVLTHWATGRRLRAESHEEAEGLDRSQHGEVGFDFSTATESVTLNVVEPRPAAVPPGNGRCTIQISGVDPQRLLHIWSELCQPTEHPDPDFLAVYPHVTTVQGTTFRCRNGNPTELAQRLTTLFRKKIHADVVARPVSQ
ncbi:MAG: ammonium transporter [Gemmataceae bacterium]|nr:ammonium transporter [Gemmataceae bacterium]MDW8244351.1 ammonium transporter [Thermogemmata sp.]